ncbi:L,D-transpeptidase family protein [Brevibacillus ruminantium]|uniref:L,D-transpeptidase family protein n=1 Tax=Brevibacillus ruminantium TaxID=2950604 RepID=A0ABY4WJQ1_9BACL|nr:L,D-transpeptidase family protein [Brevibacillus ruminantium]USG67104.1 L,D-transpeptidase family protein [Brevibacillus ruminantium]
MTKVQFLQEKSSYHITYPDRTDLSFYRWFTENHPDLAVGWYHLGAEWERQGKEEQALQAYRKALHLPADEFAEKTRDAYQELLRKRRKQTWRKASRLLLASLLFLYSLVFSPSPLSEPEGAAPQAIAPESLQRPHVEVIAVPGNLDSQQLRRQVEAYAASRRPSLQQPYTVVVVPEVSGAPLFAPLLFYRPVELRGLLRYDPVSRTVLSDLWFEQPCACQDKPAVQTALAALAEEQQTLEQVLTLRNALYRTHQRIGYLPDSLAQLAGPYPVNTLAEIPVPPPESGLASWAYYPAFFRPESAWESLKEVVPLQGYPEPFVPLQPLQVHVHKATHTMTLTSGPHIVRRYPIGIGRNGSTPEGYFSIEKKINQPQGHDNIYGTRGLVFQADGYAIHGTNQPESIGESMSLGCIRLHNPDVEELYSFAATGTEVVISNKTPPVPQWVNPAANVLPARPDEETPGITYRWLH